MAWGLIQVMHSKFLAPKIRTFEIVVVIGVAKRILNEY